MCQYFTLIFIIATICVVINDMNIIAYSEIYTSDTRNFLIDALQNYSTEVYFSNIEYDNMYKTIDKSMDSLTDKSMDRSNILYSLYFDLYNNNLNGMAFNQ